ncbi:MAG: acylphosphatase, partial [Chloroflexi bacterium]
RGKLEELIRQLHRGPPAARVEAVDVEWGEYSGRHSDFSVRF